MQLHNLVFESYQQLAHLAKDLIILKKNSNLSEREPLHAGFYEGSKFFV